MKIVHVLPSLVCVGDDRMVMDLANYQANSGAQVTLLVAADSDPATLRNALSGAVTVKALTPRGGRMRQAYRRLPGWLSRNRDLLRNQDVLHCHRTFGSVFGSLVTSMRNRWRWSGPIIVETCHSVGEPAGRRARAMLQR